MKSNVLDLCEKHRIKNRCKVLEEAYSHIHYELDLEQAYSNLSKQIIRVEGKLEKLIKELEGQRQ